MLDSIFNSIGENVINTLIEKTGLSLDQAKEVLPIGQETLQSGLMEQVTKGNLGAIIGMLNSGGKAGELQENPMFGMLKNMFVQNIMSKMGLSESLASAAGNTGMESMIGSITALVGGTGNVTEDSLKEGLGLDGGIADLAGNMLKGKLGGAAGNMLGGLFGK
ncbi:MAG: hypothetical protein AAF738_05540 [Bacteroidota bacterium]